MTLNMRKANWHRNMIDDCLNQTSGQLRFPVSAIESEYEFVDVFLQVGMGYSKDSAQQIVFQIGHDDVHGRHPLPPVFNRL